VTPAARVADVDVDAILLVVTAACARLRWWYEQAVLPAARAKADASPVTAADEDAHRILVSGLTPLLAGPVISEEGVTGEAQACAQIAAAPLCAVVDPMDGTRDFLARTGQFVVLVALLEHGVPAFGCIGVPLARQLYWARTGAGAWRRAITDGGPSADVRLAPALRLAGPPRVLVSRQHHDGEAAAVTLAFPGAAVESVGSALKYARLAEGAADLTVRRTPTMTWDTAAAQCLLAEVGGCMVDADGQPLRYGRALVNPGFVAASPAFAASSQGLETARSLIAKGGQR
jgi:3'(2'), 5'-bisphosphate nucleotidase